MSDQDQPPDTRGWTRRRERYGERGYANGIYREISNIDRSLRALEREKARIESEIQVLATMRALKVAQAPQMKGRDPARPFGGGAHDTISSQPGIGGDVIAGGSWPLPDDNTRADVLSQQP